MRLIKTTGELTDFLKKAEKASFLTVDTEFMSEKRYYAQLCLIQIATDDEAVCIDPLSDGLDLQALKPIMCDSDVLKVMHAGRQDMAIFYELFGALPTPIFDSQIVAMVCGYGENISYQKLVADLTKGTIEKASRFTDWSRRPLTDKQMAYALDDVTYLRTIYEKLQAKVTEQKREPWIAEEMGWLTSIETYDIDPMDVWQRIKTRNPKPRTLNILRFLAAWRERKARDKNQPRGRVIKDDLLIDLATQAPQDLGAMQKLRSLPKGFTNSSYANELLDEIKNAMTVPKDDWPQPPKVSRPHDVSAVVELLKVLLKYKSEEHGVASKLLANVDDLKCFALEQPDVRFTKGWRAEVFGNDAEKLRTGKLGLSLVDGEITLLTP